MADTINVKDGITPVIRQMAEQFPAEMNRAMHSLGLWFRKKIATEAKAGVPAGQPFAPLAPITLMLRGATGRNQPKSMRNRKKAAVLSILTGRDVREIEGGYGGRLFGPPAGQYGLVEYDVQKQGNSDWKMSVGFLGKQFAGSTKTGAAFQSGDSGRPVTKREHMMIRLRLGRDFPQFTQWPARPERPVFQPYADDPVSGQEKIRVLAKALVRLRQNAIDKGTFAKAT